jgi:ACDE family multidrug resistance protein
LGGAVAPFLAGKLAEIFNPHVPFIVGAGFVIVSMLFILLNQKHVKHVDHAGSGHLIDSQKDVTILMETSFCM